MNMASCLFDCLCEAELEKYYPQFLEVGLQKIEQLAKITMKDYSSLGVNNMEDRKHLFQLIKIIQSVAEEDSERTPLQPGCGHLQPIKNRSGPRRQLQFDSSLEKNQNLFPHSEFCDFPHNYAIKNPEDVIETSLPTDQRHGRTISSAGLDTNTAKGHHSKPFSGRGMANSSNGNEVPTIHRVNHVSGYNYGVPQNCLRPSVSDREGSWMETEKIRVCVRKRPLSLREERRGEMDVVTVEDKETLLIYEKKEAVNLKEYILQHVFYFDEVFSESFTNKDVYMKTAHPLIQHIFNGGNATCFAYGQTGAGKTYTMIGTAKNPGLYALTARDIFQQLESAQSRKEYFVLISFYEIYCGQLYDLLNGRKRLFAREDGNHVVQIVGLREVQVSTVDLLLEMILKGSRERSTGATGVNSDSSRSHAIIQIQIKDAASRKLGRISFVDLAGSERASDARESDKQTKIEGAEINQSLLALKECIRALDQEQAHTPFRQSKLTQVLKDSFIGNSKTCMIANVSPSHIATEHTLNTLRYADRVKELKKGMKCSPLSSNRTQTISLSPKRMQNSSFVFGDKFSPKKVKLGLQNNSTPNAGKSKGCPSVFHPGNIPFSSTPKNVNKTTSGKGNLSQAWLNHTTPVKGIIRPGSNVKKKREEQILHDNKIIPKNSSTKSDVRSEKGGIGQENNIAHNSRPSVSQRIQAVQPVQKQIVPKAALHGVQSFQPSSDCHPDSLNRPLGPDMECWTSKFPLQKEREQHLRCYHQQFQHPPILQQKLQYQPLEKTPEHYTPQELKLENSSSPKLPSCSQHEERVVLEDFDDSDFSEDSFSYSSNHKEGRKNESERLSFFLHQKSPLSETTTSVEREQGTDYAESHEHNWRSLCGSELARSNCKVDNVGGTENKALWSAEDCSSVCDSSKISNTPEKPYSSQDSPSQSKVYFFKRDNTARGNIAHLSSFSELQEKCDRLISMIESGSDKTDKATRKVEVRNCEKHHDEAVSMSSDSVSGLMAPLSVSLLQDNWPVDCAELSDRSGYQANNLNFKEAWSLDAQVDSANNISTESSIARNVSEMVKRILISKTTLNMQNSLHKENKYLSHACNHFDFHSSAGCPPFSIQQDDKGSARRENLRPSAGSRPSDSFSVKDASIDFAVTSYSENPVSQCYEADTEETPVGMKFVKNEPRLEEIVSNGSLENAEENKESISHNLPPDNSRNNANVYFNCNNQFQQLERNVGNLDEKGLEDSYILSFNDNELECLRTKLIKYIFAQKSVKEKPISSNEHTVTQKNPKYKLPVDSQTNASDMSCVQAQSAERARQLVIQAHREQLNEMTALCTREEILLNNLPSSDFKEYVTELDEIMLLKFKSIQSMRDQLKQFLASPRTEDATHTTPGL